MRFPRSDMRDHIVSRSQCVLAVRVAVPRRLHERDAEELAVTTI